MSSDSTAVNDGSLSNTGEPPRRLTLYVVRHGITVWNAEGRLQGQTDIPLSDTGRDQARALGRRLHAFWSPPHEKNLGLGLSTPPTAIYASDLSRAYETAELIRESTMALHGVPIQTTPLLRERGFGEWEGLTAAEARARFGDARSYRDEGEPHSHVWIRLEAAMAQIWEATTAPHEEQAALVVGHGGSLRQLVCLVNGLGLDAVRHFTLNNTGLSILELQGGVTAASAQGRIRLWNDTAHLVYDMAAPSG